MKPHMAPQEAEEQVRQLFSLLAIVADASKDPGRPEVSVVTHTSVPALTTGAISLLQSCLSTEDATLWRSFGDFWTKSRWDVIWSLSNDSVFIWIECIVNHNHVTGMMVVENVIA